MLELLAAKHYQDPMQLIPFALCFGGIVAVLLAWQRPGRDGAGATDPHAGHGGGNRVGHLEAHRGQRRVHPRDASGDQRLVLGRRGADRPRPAAGLRRVGGGHHGHRRHLRRRLESARTGVRPRSSRRLVRPIDAKAFVACVSKFIATWPDNRSPPLSVTGSGCPLRARRAPTSGIRAASSRPPPTARHGGACHWPPHPGPPPGPSHRRRSA
jgi:hypothetical protein